MTVIRRRDDQALTALARGIVRGDYLIVGGRREWLTSLAFMAEHLAGCSNLGLVLVPVDPHLGGYWVNGAVPGLTLTCTPVAKGDMRALQRKVDAMNAALYPERTEA